ncbi:glycosyltransferase family 2 protein [Priestia koreensis]|uniref:glycosyltransferase family 2 protein n=1 Tax=Priestia koreensis TaxID=284581 RepID=UPI00345A9F05
MKSVAILLVTERSVHPNLLPVIQRLAPVEMWCISHSEQQSPKECHWSPTVEAAIHLINAEVLLFLNGDDSYSLRELSLFLNSICYGQCDITCNRLKSATSLDVWASVYYEWTSLPFLPISPYLDFPVACTRELAQTVADRIIDNPLSVFRQVVALNYRIHHYHHVSYEKPFIPAFYSAFGSMLTYEEKRKLTHLLAFLQERLYKKGKRGGYSDGGRLLQVHEQGAYSVREGIYKKGESYYGDQKLSVIIPVKNEQGTIQQVIREVKKLCPYEIIVVVNGSTDQTYSLAAKEEVTVVKYEHALGHDVGRSIGIKYATGDILLFVDGDFLVLAQDLFPFVKAVESGVDMALNDLKLSSNVSHPVTSIKQIFNLFINHKHLGISSLTAVPHAMNRRILKYCREEDFMVPPLAQAIAAKNGFHIEAVHSVDINPLNRIRPGENQVADGLARTGELIIGDYIEAFHHLLTEGWDQSSTHFYRKRYF